MRKSSREKKREGLEEKEKGYTVWNETEKGRVKKI